MKLPTPPARADEASLRWWLTPLAVVAGAATAALFWPSRSEHMAMAQSDRTAASTATTPQVAVEPLAAVAPAAQPDEPPAAPDEVQDTLYHE